MIIRINRNIVECKCIIDSADDKKCLELIETLWNVNRTQDLLDFIIKFRINRNIVECKY